MGKAFTKAEIIERVYETLGGSKQESARLVEETFNLIKDALAGGENVKLSGFGKFNLRNKGTRPGRNPRTKQDVMIAPRRVVTFRASQILRKQVNKA